MKRIVIALLCGALGLGGAWARTPQEFDQVAPAAKAMAALLPREGARIVPAYRDRAAWNAFAEARELDLARITRWGEEALARPMPPFPREAYLDFSTNGDRSRFQRLNGARWGRLTRLAQAEWVEGKGRFLPALAETIEGLCGDPTWVNSAHDGNRANLEGRTVTIDLSSSNAAWQMTEIVASFGTALPEATRAKGLATVRRLVLDPYLKMARSGDYTNWWALSDANWNPVCHAGVVGAALAHPGLSPEERALVVGSARVLVRRYLGGFFDDGLTGEGVGYWTYGFSHFARLAETVRRATRGREDWLRWPEARKPAMSTPLARICGNLWPPVADCSMDVRADMRLTAWLAARLGFPCDEAPSLAGRIDFPEAFLFDPATLPAAARAARPAALPPRTWFPDAQILIGRSKGLCFMAMGGDNGVPHNHNDCGTFLIARDGVPVLGDLGGEVYTARTFSSRRYDSPLLNSFGHPVPRPAETLQAAGSKAAARVLAADFTAQADTLTLDLAPAYPGAPGLKTLTRRFRYLRHGDDATLEIRDAFAFEAPQAFESALTTWGTCERIAPDTLRFAFEGKTVVAKVAASAPWSLVETPLGDCTPQGRKWQALTPRRYALRLNAPSAQGFLTLRFASER